MSEAYLKHRENVPTQGGSVPASECFLTMDELHEITQHLLRFSPDALIVIDDGDRIRFANETVKDLFGHSPESLIGKPLEMLIPERLRVHHGKHTAGFMRNPNNREMGARIADLFALRADGTRVFGRHPPGSIPHQRQAVRGRGNPRYDGAQAGQRRADRRPQGSGAGQSCQEPLPRDCQS